MSHTRYGLVFGALLCIAAIAPLPAMAAASVSMFDGRPAFSEGEGRGYYVWRDGDTWHVRWTTFGSVHHFSGSVVAEGGDFFLHPAFGPFPHGDHGDDGRNADHDSQDR